MINFTKRILPAIILFTAIYFASNAQTNVSGGIYSNTTWTKANSPYIVIDTVVVFPGDTLTIEPGVTVKFDNGQYLEIREAALIAIGTSVDSITFTSNSPSPTPGIYEGIEGGGQFNYCSFQYATLAISNGGIIKNSNFINNLSGINIGNGAEIDSSNFINNNRSGVTGFLSAINVNYCSFFHNAYGLGDEDGELSGTFKNCIIDSNTIGACVTSSDFENCTINNNQTGAMPQSCYFDNCTINNNQSGIVAAFLGGGSATIIKNCTINSNSNVGVDLAFDEAGPFSGDSLVGCQIKNNGTGVSGCWGNYQRNDVIIMNVIENNTVGIDLTGNTFVSIYCNKICGNTSYDFKNNLSSNIAISDNFWCSTDSATVAAHIYDGYDNATLGLVTFMPLDTVGCYLTGCNLQITATVTNATCDACHNGQAKALVSNGTGNITYSWYSSPIQSTQTATGLAAGTYSVCVTDGNGCSACTSVFIDSTNCTGFSITANGTNATCLTCNDGKAWVNVSYGTAPYMYSWYTSPLQNTDTAYNLSQGTYSVCVTDLYGCAACDSVAIGTGACSAHFDLYPDTIALHQYIAVNMASGAGTLTYDWNWGDGSPDDNTPYPSHQYATAGFYNICLTITDTSGCTNTYCNSFYLMRTTTTMIHVTVIPPVVTGINQITSNASMYIFPNPASDNLTLFLPENISKGSFKIFNLIGELAYSSVITKQKTDIDVSHLSCGIYVLEVSYGDAVKRQKFVKE